MKARFKGVYMMHVDLETGLVRSVEIEKSMGISALDKVCTEAFKKWKFKLPTVKKVRCPAEFISP